MKPEEIDALEAYLRRIFKNERFEVRALPQDGRAEVTIAGVPAGRIVRDDEDDDLSYNFSMTLPQGHDLEPTLRTVLGHSGLEARERAVKDGSLEVYLDEEFVGVVSQNKGIYEFDMAILDYDLEG